MDRVTQIFVQACRDRYGEDISVGIFPGHRDQGWVRAAGDDRPPVAVRLALGNVGWEIVGARPPPSLLAAAVVWYPPFLQFQ